MPRPFRFPLALVVVCSVVCALSFAAHAQTMGTPEKFTATAMNLNRGAAGIIEIVVNRWSSDKDRDKLMQVMATKGPEKLLDAVQDMPRMGYFRTPDSIGWDIHYARRRATAEGGERIVLITDRRVSFWEAANQPRSIDYPFTVIEMQMNRDGEGQGTMSIATKIVLDKEHNTVTLENFETSPVLLTQIKREKTTH